MLCGSGRAMKPLRFSEPESHPLSEREVARAWDGNADSWAEQVRSGRDVYREVYNNPAFLEFIGAGSATWPGSACLTPDAAKAVTPGFSPGAARR